MGRMAARFLFSALVIFAPVHLSGQEVILPLIVEGPRQSKTAFTNQEPIELTYTVRWMDGYEPMRDLLKPHAMDFGALELDPEFADKLDIRNERKFEKENYFDITYHLRYMSEKKEEMVVPGQKFAYRDLLSSGSAVHYFSTQEFKLAYGTVLTSDAEDIKEEIDLGSYQKAAMLWKVSAGIIFLIGIIGSFVLVFFRPVMAPLAASVMGENTPQIGDKALDLAEVISGLETNITFGHIGLVCNGLSDIIRVYAPGIKPGMTSKDMAIPILSIPHEWERNRLLRCHAALCDIEDDLFVGGDDTNGKVKYHMSHLAATVRELRPWSVYWHRRISNLKGRLAKPFSSLKRSTWRRP